MKEPRATGTALRALRESSGMTLRDLATAAGASTSYISRVENGLVSPSSRWVHIVVAAIGEQMQTAMAVSR